MRPKGAYARIVAKRGASGGTKDLPEDAKEAVRAVIERELTERKWTNRDMAREWGVDISTISKVMNRKGGIGVWLLMRLRERTGTSIDEILGLPSLKKPAPRSSARAARLQEIVARAVAEAVAEPETEDDAPTPGVVPARAQRR